MPFRGTLPGDELTSVGGTERAAARPSDPAVGHGGVGVPRRCRGRWVRTGRAGRSGRDRPVRCRASGRPPGGSQSPVVGSGGWVTGYGGAGGAGLALGEGGSAGRRPGPTRCRVTGRRGGGVPAGPPERPGWCRHPAGPLGPRRLALHDARPTARSHRPPRPRASAPDATTHRTNRRHRPPATPGPANRGARPISRPNQPAGPGPRDDCARTGHAGIDGAAPHGQRTYRRAEPPRQPRCAGRRPRQGKSRQ